MNKYDNNFKKSNNFDNSLGSEKSSYYQDNDRVINAESLNIDSTLDQLSKDMHPGETLILDIGNNYYNQTDEIFDTLVLKGYDVKKTFRNGRNQILVHKKSNFE